MPLVHHELCFGCGRNNLFGLLSELESTGSGSVVGRCFIKQDHQGPVTGIAHEGVLAAALAEAMAHAVGEGVRPEKLEVAFQGAAPVGGYVELEAHVEGRAGATVHASALARTGDDVIATARARY